MIVFQQRIGRPLGDRFGQCFDEIQIALLIDQGFLVAHTRFAEQIDAERHALAPLFFRVGRAEAASTPAMKFWAMAVNPSADRLGHDSLASRPL